MSENALRRFEQRFEEDPGFERDDDGFRSTTTPFDAVVGLSVSDGAVEVLVTVRPPMLDSVVEGETVAPVVEDGWFETLELRLADAHTVATTEEAAEPAVERDDEHAEVVVAFRPADPDRAVEDARAVVEYVEGTWMQGVIPGYEYGEPAKGMIERATQNYEN